MTQEEKDLLLKDLCARLPYGVVVKDRNGVHKLTAGNTEFTDLLYNGKCNIKPYLFPLLSMTEEQKNELIDMVWSFDNDNSRICNILECFGAYRAYVDHSCCSELIDWCIKNHFDYRGLIEKGLAIDATGKNIY